MDVIKIYERSFEQQIQQLSKLEHKTENEKYKEVCFQYASIVSILSKKHIEYSLKDLLPITNVFEEYQNNYFGEEA